MTIEKIIEKTGDLPSLPTVAARINSEMNNESLNAKLLGKIISEDSSLTAKVLRLSNSAFYGMSKQITSIEKAVMILGFNTVKNLALTISIYSFFKKGTKTTIDLQGLWNHSLGCAVSSKILIEKSCRHLCDDAFLFGILHDVGKIILINSALPKVEEVLLLVKSHGISQTEAENQIFGFSHQQIAARLLKKWKFPETLIAGIKLHHDLPPETGKLDSDTAQLVRSVCVGNQMAKALSLGVSTDPLRQPVPGVMWKFLSLSRDELPGLSSKMKNDYNAMLEAWAEY